MLDLEIVGQGATTKVYRDGGTAIKLYVNAPRGEAENEAMRQTFAYDAGLPVPAVYGVRHIDEHAVALDMAYIAGEPLIRPRMSADVRNEAIATLVRLQRTVHAVSADGLPAQADRLTWKITHSPHIDATLKEKLSERLRSLNTNGGRLCHGDFHPLNVLYDGEKHWIIDWVDATSGDPLADACRTYLIFKQYMTRSSGVYLRMFCKEARVRTEDVLAWLPVIAAARISEVADDGARAMLLEMARGV